METSIRILGLTVLAPVTTGTNLLLGIQCALYWRRLRAAREEWSRLWALFFLCMSAATLAGVLKHGFPFPRPSAAHELVLWVSNLGSAASVYYAQRATRASRTTVERSGALTALPPFQVTAFIAACLVVGPEMWLVVVNTAVGLIPVLVAESRAAQRGSTSSAWIAAGLGVSMLPALVYTGRFSVGPWFNHIDLAHVLMGLSFFLMLQGCGGRETGLVRLPLRAEAEEVA